MHSPLRMRRRVARCAASARRRSSFYLPLRNVVTFARYVSINSPSFGSAQNASHSGSRLISSGKRGPFGPISNLTSEGAWTAYLLVRALRVPCRRAVVGNRDGCGLGPRPDRFSGARWKQARQRAWRGAAEECQRHRWTRPYAPESRPG